MNASVSIRWLLLGYGLFVVYGSLVPLEFVALPLDVAWHRFQQIPFLQLGLESRADWVANGVLYAPLGLLASRLAHSVGVPWFGAAALASIAGSALGVAVEFAQLYTPARTVSQNDIVAECLGSLIGAFAAPLSSAWLDRLAHGWHNGGSRLLPRLLEAYALGYVLLSFFPYDLLLSADELQGKWQSTSWSWLIAPQERGVLFTLLQLTVEVALTAPFGALSFWHRHGGNGLRKPQVAKAMAFGLLLGLCIEVGQFFVATSISQGASVLTRSLGVGLGSWLLPRLRAIGWSGLRRLLKPWVPLLALLYLPLLLAINGYFSHAWQGPTQAAEAWQKTRLLPFYYHYYTSEALALTSLLSVALAYLPVAALTLLRGGGTRLAVLIGAGLSMMVEAGKLFLADTHADPTNVLVAMAATATTMALSSLVRRPPNDAAARTDAPPTSAGTGFMRTLPALLALPLSGAWALTFPAAPLALAALLAVCAVLVWRWPLLALAFVPAALPSLDLAPWSGRFFWDEFDLLQSVVLAVALLRISRAPSASNVSGCVPRAMRLAFMVLAFSFVCSGVRALWPLAAPDANSFASYYSPYNALRILKGAAWAWAYVSLWQLMRAQGRWRAVALDAGMATGLALTVLFICAERSVFTGMFDFTADYRVTGPFSAMHKGGAYVECYVAVASAFVMATVLRPGPAWLRGAALLLLGGAAYGMLVTYSRNGYAALLAVLVTSLLVQLLGRRPAALQSPSLASGQQGVWMVALLVLLAMAAVPLTGGHARERLAQSAHDLQVRVAHWQDGLAIRSGGWLTDLFGMGVGRYPDHHYWASREPAHAATYRIVAEGDRPYLRMGQGATLYMEQIVPQPEPGALHLSFDWRAPPGQRLPVVLLCEKWTLTSRSCARSTPMPVHAAAANSAAVAASGQPASTTQPSPQPWVHQTLAVDASELLARSGPLRAPLKLSLLTPAEGWYDIARVSLSTAEGSELLQNGDFARGLDRWFFATDVDPPWHLHSLPVAVLFDQGWLGVVAWLGLLLLVLKNGARIVHSGRAQVAAALPALAGFVVSASLNTLIDAPRFLWLLLVMLALAVLDGQPETPTAGSRRG